MCASSKLDAKAQQGVAVSPQRLPSCRYFG
jgi:hypothetical protein